MGIKELEQVAGWPYTEASLVFADRVAEHDSTQVTRLRAAGAVLAGPDHRLGVRVGSTAPAPSCTAPPATRGIPSAPRGAPPGGSAAAVAGGLLPIASGGDGGGSIRIPAGFTGLFGLKATYGRIPRGPASSSRP